ncbi:MAG: phosphoribosyl transferase domain protein [Proteobacteria bacterium]|nr:phosphoribosyl transferase domain protein [Pseudomonadota bacterium]
MASSLFPRCEVVSWSAFYDLARRLARQVYDSAYRPEVIVAIGRGGYVPARVLADFLGQMDLASFKVECYDQVHKQHRARVRYPLAADVTGRRVLLVDDVADSGETFAVALAHLNSRGVPAQIRSAALHYKVVSPYVPDYYAQKVVKWRWIIYPWAVAEDVGSFLRAMDPPPVDVGEAARRLDVEHAIRLPHKVLVDLLAMTLPARNPAIP